MKLFKFNYNKYIRKILFIRKNYLKKIFVPTLTQVVLNTSSKSVVNNKRNILPIKVAMNLITGERPINTYAKNSIANFNLKENMLLGCKVNLQQEIMLNFLYKLKTIIITNLKDIKTFLNKSLDGRGNYNFGIPDYTIFPEINFLFELFDTTIGMNTIVVNSTNIDLDGKLLFSAYELPLNNMMYK